MIDEGGGGLKKLAEETENAKGVHDENMGVATICGGKGRFHA